MKLSKKALRHICNGKSTHKCKKAPVVKKFSLTLGCVFVLLDMPPSHEDSYR